jgi:hypothetical protein
LIKWFIVSFTPSKQMMGRKKNGKKEGRNEGRKGGRKEEGGREGNLVRYRISK